MTELWEQTLEQLRGGLIETMYTKYLRGSSAQQNDEVLTIYVKNEYARAWLDNRLRQRIEKAVETVAGHPMQISFEVAAPVEISETSEPDERPQMGPPPDHPLFQDWLKPTYTAENEQIIYTTYKTSDGQLIPNKRVVAPFTARFTEQLTIYDDHERRATYTISGERAGRQFAVEVGADVWADPKKLFAYMLPYLPGKPPDTDTALRRHWGPAISALSDESKIKRVKAITSTGWTPDGRAYVMPNGSIGKNYVCKLNGELNNELKHFGLKKISKREQRRALASIFALTKIYRPEILYTILAHTFLPPLIRWVGDDVRYFCHIHTDTGSLKTELAKLMISFYGPTKSNAITYKWNGTPYGAESRAHALKDCLLLIDDLKPNTISEVDQAKWVAFVQSVVDAQGRKRATIGGMAAKSRPPRAMLLSTGEAIPEAGEASYTARMLIVELNTQPRGRNLLLDHIKTNAALFSGIMYEYIAWLQRGNGCGALEEYKRLQSADIVTTHHARITNNFASNRLGAVMLAKFLHETGVLSSKRRDRFLAEHLIGLTETINKTAEKAFEERYSQRFISALQDAIGSGFANVSNEMVANRVGWQDEQYLYLLNGAKDIIDQWLRSSGQIPVNISKRDLRKQLFNDGLTHSSAARQGRGQYDFQATDPARNTKPMVTAVLLNRFNTETGNDNVKKTHETHETHETPKN